MRLRRIHELLDIKRPGQSPEIAQSIGLARENLKTTSLRAPLSVHSYSNLVAPLSSLSRISLPGLTVSEFQSSELFSETALSSQPGCPETAFYGLGRRHEVPT